MANWNEKAKQLLPCAWVIIGGKDEPQNECAPADPECTPCAKRPAVATALAAAEARGAGKDKTKLMGELYGARSACDMLHSEIVKLKAEVERLKQDVACRFSLDELEHAKAQLRAEREELKRDNADLWAQHEKDKIRVVKAEAARDAAKAKYHEAMDIMSEWKNLDSTAAIAEKWQVRIDAAVVQGLEMAKEIAKQRPLLEKYATLEKSGARDVADAIQAEIDKRKGK